MCHYIILHILLHVLLPSSFFLKRTHSLTFFIPISHVCYIYWLDVCSEMKPLLISLKTVHSGCKPSSFMSSFTHSLQVFLPLPTLFSPASSTFLQADTKSSYDPDAQTTSICHVSPPQPHSEYAKDCSKPHFASYPSKTLMNIL